jgi:hypothetical protein
MRRLAVLTLSFLALTACNQPSPTSPVLTIESLTATPDASNTLKVTFDWKIANAAKEQCHLDVTADGQSDFSFVCADAKSYVHTYSQANTYSAKLWVDGKAATSKEVSVKVEPITPQPQLSEQVFTFDKTVTWAAYQKDGVWQVLELSKTDNTVLSLTVERGAITFVCDRLGEVDKDFSQYTAYFTNQGLQKFLTVNELPDLPSVACEYTAPPMPTLPPDTAKIRGKVLGLGEGKTISISFVGKTYSGSAFAQLGLNNTLEYQSFFNLFPDTYDVIASMSDGQGNIPKQAIVFPDAVTMNTDEVIYDIDVTQAVTLDTYKLDIKGLNKPTSASSNVYAKGLAMSGVSTNPLETTIQYAAFPKNYSAATEYVAFGGADDDKCRHNMSLTFTTAKDLEVTMLPCATVTAKGGLTPSFSWDYGSSYQSQRASFLLQQGNSSSNPLTNPRRSNSVDFFGNVLEKNAFTFEDFSKLPGWKPEWSLTSEPTTYGFYIEDRQILPDGDLYRSTRIEDQLLQTQ